MTVVPRPFLDALALRALVLWAFTRGVTSVGASAIQVPYPESVLPGPVVLLAVVLFVMWTEIGRRAERLFLATLGFSFRHVAALVAAECAVLEVVLRLTLG